MTDPEFYAPFAIFVTMPNLDRQQRALYLIALVPGEELRETVRQLKLEMQKKYCAGHALKSPAHITLQMPFRRRETDEAEMKTILTDFSLAQRPFDVHLDGFDCFRPRVIFINVKDAEPIVHLHQALNKILVEELNLLPGDINRDIHPHMTIATRDLSKEAFFTAWPDYKKRNFEATFPGDRLTLLKHNGRHWEIDEHFPFAGRK